MKNSIKYIVFIIVIICCVAGLTMSYLHAHYKETGEINISKKYYDIMFTNAIVSGSDTSIKIDNDNDSIHFDIPNFNEKTLSQPVVDCKDFLYRRHSEDVGGLRYVCFL